MFRQLIPTGERSGLQTLIATTESVSSWRADEKLTAFVEVEAAIRGNRLLDSKHDLVTILLP